MDLPDSVIAYTWRKVRAALPFVIFVFVGGLAPLCGQEIKVYVSSQAGDRLSVKKALHFSSGASNNVHTFRISDSEKRQTIAGFGASILEAGLVALNTLPPANQETVLRSLFDVRDGAGFSAMKTTIAGTDFMSAGPWYTYDDSPGDVKLEHFSIARDLGPNGSITFIKRARTRLFRTLM